MPGIVGFWCPFMEIAGGACRSVFREYRCPRCERVWLRAELHGLLELVGTSRQLSSCNTKISCLRQLLAATHFRILQFDGRSVQEQMEVADRCERDALFRRLAMLDV